MRTEDSICLVKVSKRLADTMENFQDDDNDYDDQEKDSTDTPELSDEDEQQEEDI